VISPSQQLVTSGCQHEAMWRWRIGGRHRLQSDGSKIAYFPLIRHESHRKRRLQQFFVAARTCLPSRYLAAIGEIHRPTDSPFTRHGPFRKSNIQQLFYHEYSLPRERVYRAKTGGIHAHTHWCEGFMKYDVEVGSDARIYAISFIKIGLGIQKFLRVDSHTDTHRQQGDLISLLLFIFFFKTREVHWYQMPVQW
jgi:hypothetical protein